MLTLIKITVVEETQLVFRGGGRGTSEKKKQQGQKTDKAEALLPATYSEGSIDRVALIDEEMFVTGMLSTICRLHNPYLVRSHWAYL